MAGDAPGRFPSRFVNVEAARRAFGERVDVLGALLWKTDPIAEAVVAAFSEMAPGKGKRMLDLALDKGLEAVPYPPQALVKLFEHVDRPPFWVDHEQLGVGGAAFLRCGAFGLFALGAGSLPYSYTAPAGNKPLAFSRRLVEMAPRRLFDTMRFQLETCMPGGLRRRAEGFKITLRVRLVHAQMRRVLLASGRWDAEAWGAPLNQSDMAFTNVLFSAYPLEWLGRLGFHFTTEERDGLVQLWRYSGHLLGIDAALLPSTEAECRRLMAVYEATSEPPDDDSRSLARALHATAPALLEPHLPKRTAWVGDAWLAMSRFMLGDPRADALGLPKSPYRRLLPIAQAAIAQGEAVRRLSPGGNELALRLGIEIERRIVAGGEHRAKAAGSPPGTIEALLGAARRQVEGMRRP